MPFKLICLLIPPKLELTFDLNVPKVYGLKMNPDGFS